MNNPKLLEDEYYVRVFVDNLPIYSKGWKNTLPKHKGIKFTLDWLLDVENINITKIEIITYEDIVNIKQNL